MSAFGQFHIAGPLKRELGLAGLRTQLQPVLEFPRMIQTWISAKPAECLAPTMMQKSKD